MDEEVLEVDAVAAAPRREVAEPQRHADHVAGAAGVGNDVTEQLGTGGEERVVELLGGHLHGIGLALVAGQLVDQGEHAVDVARRDRSDGERSRRLGHPVDRTDPLGGDSTVRGHRWPGRRVRPRNGWDPSARGAACWLKRRNRIGGACCSGRAKGADRAAGTHVSALALTVGSISRPPRVSGNRRYSGRSGIRTHGGPKDLNGFRGRPIRPLWHPSGAARYRRGPTMTIGGRRRTTAAARRTRPPARRRSPAGGG
jgi:hypothetical protein